MRDWKGGAILRKSTVRVLDIGENVHIFSDIGGTNGFRKF